MEDSEDVLSQPSPDTGSPASPPPNGRITVAVAAAAARPPQNPRAVALPIQPLAVALPIQQLHSQPKAAGGNGGREDCWTEAATSVLVDAWGERYLELSRGNLKQKHWKEVAEIVSARDAVARTPKTDIQCKNRIDTVKKKYKQEKARCSSGGPSKWPLFKKLDHLIGQPAAGAVVKAPASSHSRVPLSIHVGARSAAQHHQHQPRKQKQQPFPRRRPAKSESSETEPEASPGSMVSCPPKRKRLKFHGGANPNAGRVPAAAAKAKRAGDKGATGRGELAKELTLAILKFGEAYEQVETSKVQQAVEMEKQRMKLAKELELQRMQFFMETQVKLSLPNRGSDGRRGGANHHRNINAPGNNRSETSN